MRWLNKTFHLDLSGTESLTTRLVHDEKTVKKVEKIVRSMDHFELTCLQAATMECKSIVLALALLCR